jgi:hypothetical protein
LAFEAAERFAAALALALLAFEVGARGCVHAPLGDRDPVEGAVELAVAAAVEVRWELPQGPFTYWRGTVTSVELEPAA